MAASAIAECPTISAGRAFLISGRFVPKERGQSRIPELVCFKYARASDPRVSARRSAWSTEASVTQARSAQKPALERPIVGEPTVDLASAGDPPPDDEPAVLERRHRPCRKSSTDVTLGTSLPDFPGMIRTTCRVFSGP